MKLNLKKDIKIGNILIADEVKISKWQSTEEVAFYESSGRVEWSHRPSQSPPES